MYKRQVQTYLVQIAPDVEMEDLLRTPHTDSLFTVIGSPRTRVERQRNGQFVVHMEGVDTYDPIQNTVEPTAAKQVAAWFLDTDYDGRTFCPTQPFFPNKKVWEKIAKDLNAVIDLEHLEAFSGTVSLPFAPGKHKRIAVKVVDRRGNELMCTHRLGGTDE